MIIDIFSHFISKSVGKVMEKAKYYGEGKEFPYPLENADPEVRLALMQHCIEEMGNLADLLPDLYAKETASK